MVQESLRTVMNSNKAITRINWGQPAVLFQLKANQTNRSVNILLYLENVAVVIAK